MRSRPGMRRAFSSTAATAYWVNCYDRRSRETSLSTPRPTANSSREQTSPLSARHIAGVMLAEESGVECTRDRYLRFFTLLTDPITCHPKSAYVSQGL
jgi:hypothetical protein